MTSFLKWPSNATLSQHLRSTCTQAEQGHTMLQQEKDIRTRVEAAMTQKQQRMQELRGLLLQEQALCDILCTDTCRIDHQAVPSLGQLDTFRHHIANLSAEKVAAQCPLCGFGASLE